MKYIKSYNALLLSKQRGHLVMEVVNPTKIAETQCLLQ
jgi:hypothetical protein